MQLLTPVKNSGPIDLEQGPAESGQIKPLAKLWGGTNFYEEDRKSPKTHQVSTLDVTPMQEIEENLTSCMSSQ